MSAQRLPGVSLPVQELVIEIWAEVSKDPTPDTMTTTVKNMMLKAYQELDQVKADNIYEAHKVLLSLMKKELESRGVSYRGSVAHTLGYLKRV